MNTQLSLDAIFFFFCYGGIMARNVVIYYLENRWNEPEKESFNHFIFGSIHTIIYSYIHLKSISSIT